MTTEEMPLPPEPESPPVLYEAPEEVEEPDDEPGEPVDEEPPPILDEDGRVTCPTCRAPLGTARDEGIYLQQWWAERAVKVHSAAEHARP